jgi:hypothetical protein
MGFGEAFLVEATMRKEMTLCVQGVRIIGALEGVDTDTKNVTLEWKSNVQ